MISHATTSDPGDEIHSYRVEKNTIIVFNDFFALVGMSVDGSYAPYHANNLNQLQQVFIEHHSDAIKILTSVYIHKNSTPSFPN